VTGWLNRRETKVALDYTLRPGQVGSDSLLESPGLTESVEIAGDPNDRKVNPLDQRFEQAETDRDPEAVEHP
jgi:hypothetical protein